MTRRLSVLLSVLPILALFPLTANAEMYVFDNAHTRVQYSVNHLGFSDMPGIFYDVKGKLDFDPGKPEMASVTATINSSAVTMNNGMLDGKLKGSDFFNTSKFPAITFTSTDIDRTGSGSGTVEGKLTLLGISRPVKLDVKFSKKAWDSYAGADAVGFTATAKIHRSDFGMKYLLPQVSDDVTILINVEALKAKASDLDAAAQVQDVSEAKVEELKPVEKSASKKADDEVSGKTEEQKAVDKKEPVKKDDKAAAATAPAGEEAPSPTPPVAVQPNATPPVATPSTSGRPILSQQPGGRPRITGF